MPDTLTRTQKYCGFADNFERCMRPIAGGYWCPLHPFAPIVEFAESRPQIDLQASEAVSEAKTGVQGDSGAGIGLPELSATPEIICIGPLSDEAKLKRLAEIKERHRAWSVTDLPRHEYAASYHDEELLLELIATTVSLPALRSLTMGVLDSKALYLQHLFHIDEAEANEAREMFCDGLEAAIREVQRRFNG